MERIRTLMDPVNAEKEFAKVASSLGLTDEHFNTLNLDKQLEVDQTETDKNIDELLDLFKKEMGVN